MKRAFSLIETIVSIAIFTLLSIAISSFVISSYRTNRFASEQRDAIQSARRGIDTMVKEIRGSQPGEDGSYPLLAAEDFSITFFSDIDGDGLAERVRYFLNGTNLQKGVIKPSGTPVAYPPANETIQTLSPYVRNGAQPIFHYYNGDYPGDLVNNPLPTPTRLLQTKIMQVSLYVDVNASDAPHAFLLESQTQLRNLKANL